MRDFNDFYYFYEVVNNAGFSAAARRTGLPKSTLSKRVARLERTLDVRLLERSTRHVRVTEIGRAFYEHCRAVIADAEAAEAVIAQARAEPQGLVRVSCPTGLMQNLIATLLPAFLAAHPKVDVQLRVMNRRVDLIEDRIDVALRARVTLDAEPQLIVRPLGPSRLVFAMGKALYEAQQALTIDHILELPTLSMNEEADEDVWEVVGPDGDSRTLRHRPRLRCSNFDALLGATSSNLGIALMPEHVCAPYFARNELVRVLPEWHTRYGTIHAVFTTRKGMLPAVRAMIDFLVEALPAHLATTRGNNDRQ